MYTIDEIKSLLNSNAILKNKSAPIDELLIDSRKLTVAKNALFFAISGKRLDGHDYLQELYKKGVKNFIVERNPTTKFPQANIIVVKNAILALQKIVQAHRQQFQYPVIAITGSNGKTIVKEWLHQCMHENFQIVRSPKSYNSQIGVPLSVWNMSHHANLGIFEAGISEPNEMFRLQKMIQPSIGVFTNIGSAHSENFKNVNHKIQEKLNLFIDCNTIIYCKDHTAINQCMKALLEQRKTSQKNPLLLFSWSEKEKADFQVIEKKIDPFYTILFCRHLKEEFQLKIPFADKSSIENAIHCVCVMLHFEYTIEQINLKLSMLKRIEMRLEQRQGVNYSSIINDSYNSDLESLRIALEFVVQQEQNEKRTLILSDILQSGFTGNELYSAVTHMLNEAKITKFIGIGKEINLHKDLFHKNLNTKQQFFYCSTEAFLQKESQNNFHSETILLKGSRIFEFEQINAFLEEKAHATVFEVNLNAIVHNLQFFNTHLEPNTKIMAMVKAFAYGSGSYEIAKLLEFHRVDYLGVAYTDEGVALRKAGVELPIMVLNPGKGSFQTMIQYNLEPEIYSIELLKSYEKVCRFSNQQDNYLIHINIDTGMNRLGFNQDEIQELAFILAQNKKLKVASIFSHLAASDEQQCDDFTHDQIYKFRKYSQQLIHLLNYTPMLHLSNSSAVLRFKSAEFDMVRIGLGLYGINSTFQKQLEPVGVFKSHISQIRRVKKGETIGYSRMGKMEKDGKIAIIAVGYADGLKRSLSNGIGHVFLNGKKAPIIGNICMDMTMIDISNLEEVKIGDEVEIFGKNILVAEVAKQANSISYEILTSISERVKRIFFME